MRTRKRGLSHLPPHSMSGLWRGHAFPIVLFVFSLAFQSFPRSSRIRESWNRAYGALRVVA